MTSVTVKGILLLPAEDPRNTKYRTNILQSNYFSYGLFSTKLCLPLPTTLLDQQKLNFNNSAHATLANKTLLAAT